ncbi:MULTISPECIES: 8-oxo-dGTP diphosphatase MutT [unclassified Gilliamella]|uniref:8-oxo-dGTP diphosphatase MutT n=1 Tax=unclassified Gilliamella TaxID=2685620 RepID=UPI00226ABC4A|nr:MULTISPECIES: 8-oxo-dGTP diphosphatase MutT [unclassified Gilliamella]MCX8574039.1 8-oxo-dGTP diphosphatase MutT [Gilliamella sp. B3831]MCX8576270.1 8-oxo-dGTP diphosphatase MutT [Gilliamella sp. B3815]MCX8578328.1 8-oxo-dGTP diphosphatase MutT [Gilliamella sp. B2717]MCX8587463.1 8-oxo-dGTP diphosphatase MutT [Gilliamella sp. B3801]MCX8591241.1 8-oxo-dGTP diphosphatase MutT [Gilliamella sp. B3804]
MRKHTEIAIGIIRSENCQIFITQRGEDSHLAGFWEFPGGKIEVGETPYQTLQREIAEEVDIQIHDAQFLKVVKHSYDDRDITIHAYLVEEWDGVPFAKEGQPSRWVDQEELNADEFPDANRPIIEMLKNLDKQI